MEKSKHEIFKRGFQNRRHQESRHGRKELSNRDILGGGIAMGGVEGTYGLLAETPEFQF